MSKKSQRILSQPNRRVNENVRINVEVQGEDAARLLRQWCEQRKDYTHEEDQSDNDKKCLLLSTASHCLNPFRYVTGTPNADARGDGSAPFREVFHYATGGRRRAA